MFDLEKSIADWRKQMLAAGIKTPVPLDELEIHLREEIERQMQSGSDGQKAFNFAIQKIGNASVLGTEFKKANNPVESQLVKLAGIICGLIAGIFSLLILHKLLAVHAVNVIERMLGLIAVALAVLSWRYGHKFLPAVRNERARTTIGAACCVAGVLGMLFTNYIPQFFVRPQVSEIPWGQILVSLIWAWTAVAVLGAVTYRLEDAARKSTAG